MHVEEPGLLDLVVDAGRFMVSRFGIAKGGAMDEYSAALANSLVGNKEGTPLLELTLKGPCANRIARRCAWLCWLWYATISE